MLRITRQAPREVEVTHALDERQVLTIVEKEPAAVVLRPLLVNRVAVAQILDADAPRLEDLRGNLGARGVERGKHALQEVDAFLERRTEVRRPDAEHVGQLLDPGMAFELAVVRGAPRDQAAHAVADQRDLLEPARVRTRKIL